MSTIIDRSIMIADTGIEMFRIAKWSEVIRNASKRTLTSFRDGLLTKTRRHLANHRPGSCDHTSYGPEPGVLSTGFGFRLKFTVCEGEDWESERTAVWSLSKIPIRSQLIQIDESEPGPSSLSWLSTKSFVKAKTIGFCRIQ
jgi:hypothetical protein